MELSRRTTQLLHDDHQATIEVIEALDQLIARARKTAPDTTDPAVLKTLRDTSTAIEQEVRTHFAFEEEELFTRLEEMGDVSIGAHLRSEHAAILAMGESVVKGARAALENGFTDQTWASFRNSAAELIERMFAHIQKEEMALLPALEDILDPETDMELSGILASAHG